jgi:hypothetical protein
MCAYLAQTESIGAGELIANKENALRCTCGIVSLFSLQLL